MSKRKFILPILFGILFVGLVIGFGVDRIYAKTSSHNFTKNIKYRNFKDEVRAILSPCPPCPPGYICLKGRCIESKEDPVSGTLSVDKTTASVGEKITLTVTAQDDQGVFKVGAWYHKHWHWQYCYEQTFCSKTFTFSESTPGTRYYYGYVYGRKLNRRLEGRYTDPKYVKVRVIQKRVKKPNLFIYPSVETNENYTRFTIGNNGNAPASRFTTILDLAVLGVKATSSISQVSNMASSLNWVKQCDYFMSSSFAPGAKTTYICNYRTSLIPNTYYAVRIRTDVGNSVEESNENDNVRYAVFKAPAKKSIKGKEDPVSGTLSVDKTTASVGEKITLTVTAQDDQGVFLILAWYHKKWHKEYCHGETFCKKTWTFSESTPGIKYYYGYVYGKKLSGKVESSYTKPPFVKVMVTSRKTPPCDSYGDLNDDGVITKEDVDILSVLILNANPTKTQKKKGDINGDKKLDYDDLKMLELYLQGVIKNFPVCEKLLTCHRTPLWSWNYCTPDCPCKAGEGDCDTDDDCITGYCAQNVGKKYGQPSWMDVCEIKPSSSLPDLTVEDIYYYGPYIRVKYCNRGKGRGTGDFLIKLRNEETGKEFGGNPNYRFKVPAPGTCATTGGFICGLIGLYCGQSAKVSAIIDWENRVKESNENNNVLTKRLGRASSLSSIAKQLASISKMLADLMERIKELGGR